jgi:hypothetical protein
MVDAGRPVDRAPDQVSRGGEVPKWLLLLGDTIVRMKKSRAPGPVYGPVDL